MKKAVATGISLQLFCSLFTSESNVLLQVFCGKIVQCLDSLIEQEQGTGMDQFVGIESFC